MRYFFFFLFQAEDGIRDLVRSRGLGDVYKRQKQYRRSIFLIHLNGFWKVFCRPNHDREPSFSSAFCVWATVQKAGCLLYTSDAADERSSVDLGGRRILKKQKKQKKKERRQCTNTTEH